MKRFSALATSLIVAFAAVPLDAKAETNTPPPSFKRNVFDVLFGSSKTSNFDETSLRRKRDPALWNGQRDPASNRPNSSRRRLAAEGAMGVDPEPAQKGLGLGNMVYVAGKLYGLVDTKLIVPAGADEQQKSIISVLSDAATAIRVTREEKDAVLAFYQNRNFKPVWIANKKLTRQASNLLAFLSRSDQEGLKPENYLPPVLKSYANPAAQLSEHSNALWQLDVGLSAMAVRYAQHMSGGQLDPMRLSGYHDIQPEKLSASSALSELAAQDSAVAYLKKMAPEHPAYGQLKTELKRLKTVMKTAPPFVKIENGKSLRPGQVDSRILALRQRLKQLGFLASDISDSHIFDSDMSYALKNFQAANGIKPTGFLENDSVKALNQDHIEQNIVQLTLNLERLRWLKKDLGARYVFVNEPAFEVRLIDDGATVWRSKIIIGKPLTQTFAFSDVMETVVFNPSWGVPQSIIINEMIPRLKKDSSYLDRQDYLVTDLKGQPISSSSVNWAYYAGKKVPYNVQQRPGPGNALGELKFLFPNKHDIYMHDTPDRKLFAREMRAFSHGCIRVENPRDFAAALLNWSRKRVDQLVDSRQKLAVSLTNKLPVHLVYFTAWPEESGKIRYYHDLYGRNIPMERALSAVSVAQAGGLIPH